LPGKLKDRSAGIEAIRKPLDFLDVILVVVSDSLGVLGGSNLIFVFAVLCVLGG
jgi:hypothetical protein